MGGKNGGTQIGLQDLLFNGAVGCLLLFIIFAIRTNGGAVISHLGENGVKGKFQSSSSMPINLQKTGGRMISYRRVILKSCKDKRLKEEILEGKYWSWQPLANDDYFEYVEENNDDLIFSIAFERHPANLSLNLKVPDFYDQPYEINVAIIEGANVLDNRASEQFRGYWFFNEGKFKDKRAINNLKIDFTLVDGNGCNEKMINFR